MDKETKDLLGDGCAGPFSCMGLIATPIVFALGGVIGAAICSIFSAPEGIEALGIVVCGIIGVLFFWFSVSRGSASGK